MAVGAIDSPSTTPVLLPPRAWRGAGPASEGVRERRRLGVFQRTRNLCQAHVGLCHQLLGGTKPRFTEKQPETRALGLQPAADRTPVNPDHLRNFHFTKWHSSHHGTQTLAK